MKKVVFTLLVIASAHLAFAQVKKTEESPKSKLESFSDRSGSVIKKEFINIQSVGGLKFQILKITDLTTNSVVTGLRIEGKGTGTYSSTKIAFLDSDEIDGLIKALDYITTEVITVIPPENDIEYHFKSRSGFDAGAYNYKGKWYSFLKLEKYDSDSSFDFSIENINTIKSVVKEAKTKL